MRRPIIEPVLPHIEQILQEDTKAPKKQRHTAKRIWERLRDEHGFSGGESTIVAVVREMKSIRKEVFLPLSHPPGEAQIDFGFAKVILAIVETIQSLLGRGWSTRRISTHRPHIVSEKVNGIERGTAWMLAGKSA